MRRHVFKISIIKLLILSNCLIMAAFFGINSYLSQRRYTQALEQEFKEKQYQMLVYIGSNVEQSMQSIELLARSTANNYSIINNLLNDRKNQNSYEQMVFQNNMSQNLSTVAYTLGDIVSVNILLDEQELKTTKLNGVYHYESYMKGEMLELLRGESAGWLPTRPNDLLLTTYADYISSYVLKIYSGLYYGDALGHLVVNLDEDFFYQQLKGYHQNSNSDILLADAAGHIISSTDRSILGQDMAGTDYGIYQEAMGSGGGTAAVISGRIVSKRYLKEQKLYLIAVSDYQEAVRPIRETQRVVLLISLSLLALVTLFSGILAYRIVKPIKLLSKEVTEFQESDMKQEIEITSSLYEIDVLGREFNQMMSRIRNLIDRLLEQEKLKKKNELEVLQAQINPHFLYNTLEAINWMALSMKQKEISNMVILLGNFLRLSLNKGKTIYRVRDELNHLKCYMDIQNIRCKGKILFSADVDEKVLDFRMIKLLLQPLVENSILHGFDFRGGAGQIWVKVYQEEEFLYFTVIDDGCGMSNELIGGICDMESEIGHGLKNIMKRIQLYYGGFCGVEITSTPMVGTTVEIKIVNFVKED